MTTRRGFMRRAAVTAALPAASLSALAAAPATPSTAASSRAKRLLVLSGGVAWGAYEAGVIHGLSQAKGGAPAYDAVCATSAGTLNGAFFVTNQSAALFDLWSTIAARTILEPLPQFAKILNTSSGIFNRAAQILRLVRGVVGGNVQGVCSSLPVIAILNEFLLERGRLKEFSIPFYWTATDLTKGCGGIFYRGPSTERGVDVPAPSTPFTPTLAGARPTAALTPAEVIEALRASSAFPGVFLPALINGQLLVDGGVVNNTPVSLVREAVNGGPVVVDVVILNAQDFTGQPNQESRNLLSIGLALFNMVSQRLVDDGMHQLVTDDAASRVFRNMLELPASGDLKPPLAALQQRYGLSSTNLSTLLPNEVTINALRPASTLAGNPFDFTDQRSIDANLNQGVIDVTTRGFQPYEPPNAVCILG